jgi:predicted AlkP superfamily phosphohydrolase/phosphomutase
MRVLVLGFDAFDPVAFDRLSGEGRLPNLTRYADAGGYAPFAVSNPPQSEVSWTSIATGLNPGGHGMFDFVHRNPATYGLSVSLLPTKRSLAGTQFVPPHRARTIFDQVAYQGYPATSLWWPATFPARPESPVRTLPGLGTPDVQGRLGVGTLFASEPSSITGEGRKTDLAELRRLKDGRYRGVLHGPTRKKRKGTYVSSVDVELDVLSDDSARLTIDGRPHALTRGLWSDILEVSFRMGRLLAVRSLTRVILTQTRPEVRMYSLPLQIHPLHTTWRYASPRSFVQQLWKSCGPLLTLGWPQDTTALEEGCISDEQFQALCTSIFDARECVLMQQLAHFREGILAVVFDSLDRLQHMYWSRRPEIVDEWYVRLDSLLGRVEDLLAAQGGDQTKIIVVSDHGFAELNYKVHLNRWLVEQGHLVTRAIDAPNDLQNADWSQSQAYAIGLNSMYLNLQGREGQGCVPAEDRAELAGRIRSGLLAWRGPDGLPVVQDAWLQGDVFQGPLTEHGPDVVVGYSPGYRASQDTGLGKWKDVAVERNLDRWGADHCMDPAAVPGVLFCNQGLRGFPRPSYRDFPFLAIGEAPDERGTYAPAGLTEEDSETVEERLRGLGYL